MNSTSLTPLWISLGAAVLAILLAFQARLTKTDKIKLVVSRWYASNQPDHAENYVVVEGRSEGIISWVLTLMGVDAASGIWISESAVHFRSNSLSGPKLKIIPFTSVSAILYEYHKPWISALFLQALFFNFAFGPVALVYNSLGFPVSLTSPPETLLWLSLLIGIIAALIYYILNRKLTLGFVEHSGAVSMIQFKRSVIENQEINEEQASYVCLLVQRLIENERWQKVTNSEQNIS